MTVNTIGSAARAVGEASPTAQRERQAETAISTEPAA